MSGTYVDLRDGAVRYIAAWQAPAHKAERKVDELTDTERLALIPHLVRRVADLEERNRNPGDGW